MIVKDAEKDIPHCLNSVKSVVDQIVVIDTGSTDRTKDVAAQFGAQVQSIPWENHFAEARNAGINLVTTDWVLVLDADEELSVESASRLRSLLTDDKTVGGYRFLQRNYKAAATKQMSSQTHFPFTGNIDRAKNAKVYIDNPSCRLFRRDPRIFYRRRIHEMIELQITASGMSILPSDLIIHHFGFLADTGSRNDKDLRYLELLKLAVDDDPHDDWNWMQLGMAQELLLGDTDAAIQSYRKAGELCAANPNTWVSLANLYLQRKQCQEAIQAAAKLPDNGEHGVIRAAILGDALHGLGRIQEAHQAYTAALQMARSNASHSGMESNLFLESRLGYTEVQLGMVASGLNRLKTAVEAAPDIPDNQDRLVKALLLAKRIPEAAQAAEAAIPHSMTEANFARAAALRMHIGDKQSARRLLDEGVLALPTSAKLRELRTSIC